MDTIDKLLRQTGALTMLSVPTGYDEKVVSEWVGELMCEKPEVLVIDEFENDDNYCVLVKTLDEDEYWFVRFFKLDDKTVCSQDFIGGINNLIREFGKCKNAQFE